MSDLTRRVLDAHVQNPDLEQDTPEMADSVYDLATAAPTLARQVEALEALAKRLEWEADPDNHGDHDYGFDDTRNAIAARIRDALNNT